jgi:hypothetical protein
MDVSSLEHVVIRAKLGDIIGFQIIQIAAQEASFQLMWSACWLHYYDMDTILFAKYYILCCIQQYSWIHFIAFSQVGSQDVPKYTPEYNLKYVSNSTQSHIPSLLHSMLPGKFSRSVQVHSKYVPGYISTDILKYTSLHALNNAPNSSWWYTRSHICSYVGSQDALKHTSRHALKYVPNCMT